MKKSLVCIIIAIVLALTGAVMQFIDVQPPDSIGVIGGADGPTAIYVNSGLSGNFINYISITLLILGIIIGIVAGIIYAKSKK